MTACSRLVTDCDRLEDVGMILGEQREVKRGSRGGSSSVCGDLAWEPEGHQFRSSSDQSIRTGIAGEVPLHLLDAK